MNRYRPKSAFKEMFKYRNHITHMMKIRGKTVEKKREMIETSSGPLWYIFGYKLVDKPWLTYEERFL